MIRLLAALAALVLLAVPASAHAQTVASPPPSARQLELAQQILDETGMTKNYDAMVKDMIGRIMAGSAAIVPDSPPAKEAARALNDAMTVAMVKLTPRLLDLGAKAYAQTFSEEELAGILKFYRTPVGQSMAAKMPQLTRNITDATVKLMPEMMEVMMTEMCAARSAGCAPRQPPTPKT